MTQFKDCVRAEGHGFYVKKNPTNYMYQCFTMKPPIVSYLVMKVCHSL